MSSHSYSSTSYSHGQSCDKTGKKHLPKRILIYPVPMAAIFGVSSLLLLILSIVLWLPHLQLQKGLNHSQSNLLISRCLSFSYRNRLSSIPMLLLTQMDILMRDTSEMSVLQEILNFPIRIMVSSLFPQGSQECVKIPPVCWSSLIYLLPSEQPGLQHDNTLSTCTEYLPNAQVALQMVFMKPR